MGEHMKQPFGKKVVKDLSYERLEVSTVLDRLGFSTQYDSAKWDKARSILRGVSAMFEGQAANGETFVAMNEETVKQLREAGFRKRAKYEGPWGRDMRKPARPPREPRPTKPVVKAAPVRGKQRWFQPLERMWRWVAWQGSYTGKLSECRQNIREGNQSFGQVRKHDIHTGVDLYADEGQHVSAVEPGRVVAVLPFTGPPESPWWLPTQCVMVEGASGVVCYGEVLPRVKEGDHVVAMQVIATVLPVLREAKTNPPAMLHLELYAPGIREPMWWKKGELQPKGLLDPTLLLQEARPNNDGYDLTKYTTRQLLYALHGARAHGAYYPNGYENADHGCYLTYEEVKEELAFRPHVPKGKAGRQLAQKRKKEGKGSHERPSVARRST
jgi:hypothetical protein